MVVSSFSLSLSISSRSDKNDGDQQQQNRGHREEAVYGNEKKGFGKFLATNKTLNTSEFGSGITMQKRKNKSFGRN